MGTRRFWPTLFASCLIVLVAFPCAQAGEWEIPWEAAKGEHKAVLPYKPLPLDRFLLEIPAGHEEANRDRKEGLKPAVSRVTLLTMFRGRSIFRVLMEVEETYYNRYWFIVAEVEQGRYMPLCAHQYFDGSVKIEDRVERVDTDQLELSVFAEGGGKNGSRPKYKISLGNDFKPRYVFETE